VVAPRTGWRQTLEKKPLPLLFIRAEAEMGVVRWLCNREGEMETVKEGGREGTVDPYLCLVKTRSLVGGGKLFHSRMR
jgi:hypothetical protein